MCQTIRFSTFEFSNEQVSSLKPLITGDEIRMHVNHPKAVLPIELHGQNHLIAWGNKTHPKLPRTGFCKVESLEAGQWRWLNPKPVKILASFGRSNGVWFQIRVGIRGILIHDENGTPHCFMLTQAATHYFKVMTGKDRMPALMEQIL